MYKRQHTNNVKRVIRALEYYRQTGKPISQHNEEQRQKESPYNLAYFVLNDEDVYKRQVHKIPDFVGIPVANDG